MSAETILTDNEIKKTHLDCDSNDKNSENIIIEVKEIGILEKSNANGNNTTEIVEDTVDSPDLLNIGDYRSDDQAESIENTESVALCETLYKEEDILNTEYPETQILGTDGHFLLAEPETVNLIEDIPNEILVYTCQPVDKEPIHMFPCKSCEIVVGCIFCLKSHYESIHLNLGLIQYKCEQTTYLKNYTEICHKCNLVCESREEMFEHRKIHYVTCDVCDMSFDNALFLSNHCKTSHEKFEVIISCDLCEQWFKQLQDLSDHYQAHHEMILCIVCFKRFSNVKELVLHHSTHKIILTDPKPILPYACSKCNHAFAEISELSSHLVKEHPTKKANYGSLSKKRSANLKSKQRKKWKIKFDDCGGLSQEDDDNMEDLENEEEIIISTKIVKVEDD